MSRERRKRIDILFAEEHPTLRTQLRSVLLREGYGNVDGVTKFEEVRERILGGPPDLIIVDLSIGEPGEAPAALRALRHSTLGENPFVPVIVTAWEPSADTVRAVVDAGIDAFITKPFAPKQMLERIHQLTHARKPFVVTSDYIGPDRRKDPSRGSTIETIEAPNSLRAKEVEAVWDADAFLKEVKHSQRQVGEERIRRLAFQISFLIDLIVQDHRVGRVTADTAAHVSRLAQTAVELNRGLPGTAFASLHEIVNTLVTLAGILVDGPGGASSKDLRLLPLLGMALMKAAFPNKDEAALAHDVASAVAGYRARQGR